MKKTLPTLRYLFKSSRGWIVIGFLVILVTVAVTDLVYNFTSRHGVVQQVVSLTVPFEFTAAVFSLLIGLVLFISSFKVALANGVSRKTFLLANLLAAGIAAAAFSIFNLVVVLVHGLFWPVIMISQIMYPFISWPWLLILQFAGYLLVVIAGWLIALAYYRSSNFGKSILSLAPIAVIAILQVANARSGGALFAAISQYQSITMRMDRAPFTMLAYAAILCGLVYLLLRRAPLKY